MSIIISNKKTLGNAAICVFSVDDTDKTISNDGDFTIIKNNDGVVTGINIKNYAQYFEEFNGVKTITQEMVQTFNKELNLNIEYTNYFVVGKIIHRDLHPKSNKLFVLKVDIGNEVVQIVTNTLNSVVDALVVVAKVGATLPNGMLIKHSKVMGVESEGMLTGGETLGIAVTDGILIIKNKNPGDEYILGL